MKGKRRSVKQDEIVLKKEMNEVRGITREQEIKKREQKGKDKNDTTKNELL
jgi:hypothetical protein